MSEITLIARITFAAPLDEALRAGLAVLTAATRAEAGCMEYAAHVHAEDPRRIVFYERWRDQAALDAHNASAHLAAWRSLAGPRLAEAPGLDFWRRL